jgi:hypothetical protein
VGLLVTAQRLRVVKRSRAELAWKEEKTFQ